MQKPLFIAAVIALLAPAAAHAGTAQELAAQKGCMDCHTLAGEPAHAPSFLAIARKYHNRADAEGILVKVVMQGNPVTGGYHWSLMPEPRPGGRQQVSEPEARQLVQWILRMKQSGEGR